MLNLDRTVINQVNEPFTIFLNFDTFVTLE